MDLAAAFAARGRRVVAVTQRPPDTYQGIRAQRLAYLAAHVDFAQADLTGADGVAALVQKFAPSLWIHHAGFADSYASPDYDVTRGFQVNVVALNAIYNALAGRGCGVIVT